MAPARDRASRVRFVELSAGYAGRPVLHQLTAEIGAMTMTALVGPNGSRKSTLLGVTAGVIDPTSHITDLATRQLGELSGGQRQRALIAQGLVQESDLLLLDEPTTGLDPEARQRITVLLTELVADGVTVVQATHDLEAARSANSCLLLRDGHLVAQGRPEQVLTTATLAQVWQPA
ncbi:metal ABC transporter ATP-binding protein [Streptomyces albicerus]|uniref:metal ABC transporter ATP-binding protein n=1 Tax=Streptomyces albicerus TaxID=2569859 RepID=UPI00124B3F98|nr:ATP-binding cassette domain-containing protein [Streptomyces albicerus]